MSQINTFGENTSRRLLELLERQSPVNDSGSTSKLPLPEFQFRPRNVFRNDSGDTIPAFGLMRVTGLEVTGDRYVLTVDQPDGTSKSAHVINGPRPVTGDARGSYQDASNYFVIRTDETSGSVGPGDDWIAVTGRLFAILGVVDSDAGLALASPSRQILAIGKAASNIAPGETGDIDIYRDGESTGETIEASHDWMHGDQQISQGIEVVIAEFFDEQICRIIGAECEEQGN